jgi:hypothetical protein
LIRHWEIIKTLKTWGFFSLLWGRWICNNLQENLVKFGYKSKRKFKMWRNPFIMSWKKMSKYDKLKGSYLEKNSNLATLILIKLFVEMLKISNINSKIKKLWRKIENLINYLMDTCWSSPYIMIWQIWWINFLKKTLLELW